MKNILFVCTGNTCRSPMAEAIANKFFKERGIAAVASSCGIYATDGSEASKNAMAIMKNAYDTDISDHRARIVCEEYLAAADIVIAVTEGHKNHLCAAYPGYADKVYAMGEFGEECCDVDDPYGGSLEIYKETAAQIQRCFENIDWEGCL